MTRKLKRTRDYELSLQIGNDQFVCPPRDSQRNWVLNNFLKEAAEDLKALDVKARSFVKGGEPQNISDRADSELGESDIMEEWQIPVMEAMADEACARGGDVLEIGFGRGIASDFIQAHDIVSHTIVECNIGVIAAYERWRAARPDRDIQLIAGKWQDTVDRFGQYDGIFFHTYPLGEEEYVEYVAQSSTFAEHFFRTAAAHLKPCGVFTYLTNEADSLSRAHQRALLEHFCSFQIRIVTALGVPENTRDSHWSQSMVIVRAIK